jgi:branched-chain amino acid transport system ATP-binding protein
MAQLEVSDVTVRFGGNTAVQDVSLSVGDGIVTGLIGPNGAGKTTLFNVITGLQPAARGKVRLDGRDISGLPPYRRARLGLARTFQRLELFGALTVRENIQVAASLRKGWGSSEEPVAETVNRLIARLSLGPVADVRADSLPTGQGRLLELGRCLAVQPSVLLLDEPASGQDESETERFAEILRELVGEGIAILLVEHDMGLVMSVCEHIFVLDFGRLIASGSPRDIRADVAVQAAYLGADVHSE